MGQQQLILLVLATVIVGLAIVVGIAAFTQGGDRANADAMIQDAVTIASDIQAAIKKPAPFGGVDDFDEITFGVIGYPADGTGIDAEHTNGNGQFELEILGTDDGVLIKGLSSNNPDWDGNDNEDVAQEIQVAVCGLSENDIQGATFKIGGQATGQTADLTCT